MRYNELQNNILSEEELTSKLQVLLLHEIVFKSGRELRITKNSNTLCKDRSC